MELFGARDLFFVHEAVLFRKCNTCGHVRGIVTISFTLFFVRTISQITYWECNPLYACFFLWEVGCGRGCALGLGECKICRCETERHYRYREKYFMIVFYN